MTRFVAAGSSGLPCPPLWPGPSTSCSWPGSCWSPAPSTRFQQSESGSGREGPAGPMGARHPVPCSVILSSASLQPRQPSTLPRAQSRWCGQRGETPGGCGHLKPALIRGHFRLRASVSSSLSQGLDKFLPAALSVPRAETGRLPAGAGGLQRRNQNSCSGRAVGVRKPEDRDHKSFLEKGVRLHLDA